MSGDGRFLVSAEDAEIAEKSLKAGIGQDQQDVRDEWRGSQEKAVGCGSEPASQGCARQGREVWPTKNTKFLCRGLRSRVGYGGREKREARVWGVGLGEILEISPHGRGKDAKGGGIAD